MGDGFIPGSRGSFALDFVATAIGVILVVQSWSVVLVRHKKNYRSHKKAQLLVSLLLALALAVFEIHIRIYGWTHLAEPSPFYHSWVFPTLYLHLFFAFSCAFLWLAVLVTALTKFPNPPSPHPFSKTHRRLAWGAITSLAGTAVSGWLFYWLAFIAI